MQNCVENQYTVAPKRLTVLGSTGSIGRQTLEVIEEYPERFEAACLIAGSNAELLARQATSLRVPPRRVVIADESRLADLQKLLAGTDIEVAAGVQAVVDAMAADDFSTVVTATVGYSGLAPTLAAIQAGKDIALANKETLVVAGAIVKEALRHSPSRLLPVDSEHAAIHQCLRGEKLESIRRLIITASGGPFRTFSAQQLKKATRADALHHPNWSMGAKITIDSATMMNKAFEIIEAHWLFGVEREHITAVVHPQSIVHSMVEFTDGAVKAQLGVPDMRLPIRYALGDAERLSTPLSPLTLDAMMSLTFEAVDAERFPCFNFGQYALEKGGNAACIINAANEVAVAAFLHDRIGFTDIYRTVSDTLAKAHFIANPSYDDLVATHKEATAYAAELIK